MVAVDLLDTFFRILASTCDGHTLGEGRGSAGHWAEPHLDIVELLMQTPDLLLRGALLALQGVASALQAARALLRGVRSRMGRPNLALHALQLALQTTRPLLSLGYTAPQNSLPLQHSL